MMECVVVFHPAPSVCVCSKKKVRGLYGKWIEAMFSLDVPVFESYLKSAGSGGSSKSDDNEQKVSKR